MQIRARVMHIRARDLPRHVFPDERQPQKKTKKVKGCMQWNARSTAAAAASTAQVTPAAAASTASVVITFF